MLDGSLAPTATALIVDGDEQVLEAAWANLWLIEGERLITPPADGRLLPGVTRAAAAARRAAARPGRRARSRSRWPGRGPPPAIF